MTIGVAIVGCGQVGQKRAQALAGASLVACADLRPELARALAQLSPGAKWGTDWPSLLSLPEVDVVVVATTNDMLATVSRAALEAGKHVMIEKPAARSVSEIDSILEIAATSQRLVRVGFNHRYHPALRKARELVDAGTLGSLMFVRGRYGHGGRPGYENEWRANPAISGGGELIDQGVHLIDLSRWFLGEFTAVTGIATTYFWQMPVDDNAFLLLRTRCEKTAMLHVSCTEWKNLFSLEIYGQRGKLHAEGLGGSYGTERLAFYRMVPAMGPPETTIWEYPQADDSWRLEFSDFMDDIRLNRPPSAGLIDARAALAVVEQVYADSGYAFGIPAGELHR